MAGMLHDEFPIVTEMRRVTRSGTLEKLKPNGMLYEEGLLIVKKFAKRIVVNVNERIENNNVVQLTAGAFRDWDDDSFAKLAHIAHTSGKDYGDFEELQSQYHELLYCIVMTYRSGG